MNLRARISGLLLTAALLLTSTGCVPVVWLPDSSSFVYVTYKNAIVRLMHYDVKSKKLRTLVDKMPPATVRPAVSPDGKQIAITALLSKPARTMQIIIYNLEGKEVRRSPAFPWASLKAGREEPMLTGVFWAGDRILVHDFLDLEPKLGKVNHSTTGIYDLKKNTLITVEGRPAAFGGTPFMPSGKGFLVSKPTPWTENTPHGVRNGLTTGLAVVDWQGKVQAIDTEPIRKADLKYQQIGLLSDSWGGTSRWVGNIAEVTQGALRLKIDTDKRIGTVGKVPEAESKADGAIVFQQFTFPGSRIQVRTCLRGTGNANWQLELVKEARTVALKKARAWLFSPSPDGKWLAVREFPGDGNGPGGVIFLIDEGGEHWRFDARPSAKE